MQLKTQVQFPRQELRQSVGKIHIILDSAQALADQLVSNRKVKDVINKCTEALQVLLTQAENEEQNWQKNKEDEAMEILDLRQKLRNGTITLKERARLKQLEGKSSADQ